MSSSGSKPFPQQIARFLLACLLAALSAGCYGGGTEIGNPRAQMSTFQSDSELETYLKERYAQSVLPSHLYGNTKNTDINQGGVAEGEAPVSVFSETPYSRTNNQEEAVDEADKIKTDGRHLYVAGQGTVTIVNVSAVDDMRIESTIDIDGSLDSLHLYKDSLLIVLYFQNGWQRSWVFGEEVTLTEPVRIGMPYWIPMQARTNVAFYDVTDPTAPRLIRDIAIDGDFISTRLIGGKLHLVQQFLPVLPPLEYVYDGTEADRRQVVEKNQASLAALHLNDLLPGVEIRSATDQPSQNGRLVQPQDVYRPTESGGAGMVTVTSFDLEKPDNMQTVGILATAGTVYASTNALYVSTTEWNYDNSFESNTKSTTHTVLYKFDLNDSRVRFKASGRLEGYVLDQFSMGEHEDILRVATASFSWSAVADGRSGSTVACLREVNDELRIVGRIDNIAPGENLYAARFIGDRGFLVTFVRVDPLFTLDLSDPEHPRIAGELKVPGYSEYIHPLDPDHLLTIGMDIKEQGGVLSPDGVQLSVFDITDFTDPRLLHHTNIGEAGATVYSEALWNHKAFTYFPDQRLLAIPVTIYPYTEVGYPADNTFYGLEVYRVSLESGFDFLGRIRTDSPSGQSYSSWLRGVFMGEHVFSVSDQVVHVAAWADIDNTIRTLVIGTGADDPQPYLSSTGENPSE